MKIAITGATGFLGRALVQHLTERGHECRGLIRPDRPRAATRPAIEWVVGSLGEVGAVRSLVDRVDAVIHAAHDSQGGSFQDPQADVAGLVDHNLLATIRLIEAAKTAGVQRLVVISSGAVHDDILDDRPLDETHPLWPRSHYGATKAAIEAFVHSYGRGERFPITALRPTAIYGRAEPIAASRWYNLIAALIRREDVVCRKGGKQVHVRDVARAVELLLTAEGVSGEVYHCTDLFVPERRVAELARSIVGTTSAIEGDVPAARHLIDCRKLKGLGMRFGGEALLEATVAELVHAISSSDVMN